MKLIGNGGTVKQIYIAMKAARERNRALPHMLFSGAAGCGKTSMARQVASWNRVNFIPAVAESVSDHKSVVSLMEKLEDENYDSRGNAIGQIRPSIVFIDEIHNLPLLGQEVLGMAMENFLLESKNAGRYNWLPYFTLVGATTDDGKLSKPFRDRFKMRFVFEPYNLEESIEIVKVHATRLGIPIDLKAAVEIAKRGRGVPRIIVGYLERARDLSVISKLDSISVEVAYIMFKELGIDETGLTKTDLKILKTLHDVGIPVGLDNLSVIINEAPKTILSTIEPFLIQQGLMVRSGRGRIITNKGTQHLVNSDYLAKNSGREEIDIGYVRK